MLGSTVLETAIGMVFVFLVMSLIVTAGTELIAGWRKWRTANLWKGVSNLIDGTGSDEWTALLYEHPLIQGLTAGSEAAATSRWKIILRVKKILVWVKALLAARAKGPSYIPSRTFAVALLDVVSDKDPSLKLIRRELQYVVDGVPLTASPAELKTLIKAVIAKIAPEANVKVKNDLIAFVGSISDCSDITKTKTGLSDIIEKIPQTDASLAKFRTDSLSLLEEKTPDNYAVANLKKDVQDLIRKIPYAGATSEAIKTDLSTLIKQLPDSGVTVAAVKADVQNFLNATTNKYIREAISQIDNSKLATSLMTLMDDANQNIDKLKEDVEIWFNNSMDRVTGWYKRKTQVWHLLLAFVFTVLLNVDSVSIVKSLMRDPDLRKAVVAQAEKFSEQPSVPASQLKSGAASAPGATTNDANPSFSIDQASVVGGNALKGTFKLGAQDKAGGSLTLASSDTKSVTVDEQAKNVLPGTSVEFAIVTKPVTTAQTVVISAKYNGATYSAPLLVNETPEERYRMLRGQLDQLNLPIGWHSQKVEGSLILKPDMVPGGSIVKGSFTLGEEDEENTRVEFKSDDETIAKVINEKIAPNPKNPRERQFQLRTEPLGGPAKVTISARYGNPVKTHTATLNISSDYRYWPGWYWPWNDGFGDWLGLVGTIVGFHLIGWILTAIAASVGAPFWFDMLNKIITIRSSGKAPEEKPKPPKDVPQPLEPGQTPREADQANK